MATKATKWQQQCNNDQNEMAKDQHQMVTKTNTKSGHFFDVLFFWILAIPEIKKKTKKSWLVFLDLLDFF